MSRRRKHSLASRIAALVALLAGCGEAPRPSDQEASGPDSAGETQEPRLDLGLLCLPGTVECRDATHLQECAATGQEWVATACGEHQQCEPCLEGETCAQARCVGPCETEEDLPSSAGCSFIANRVLHFNEDEPDALIVGNPSSETAAKVQLYYVPEGKRKEEPVGEPIELAPGESHVYELDGAFILGSISMFRTGGIYRVESDVPIIAYQHSPLVNSITNDASMLLPEAAMGQHYVAASYPPWSVYGAPSYFVVIGLEDGTTVRWTPPVDTAGNGLPIKFVAAGEEGEQKMNRFDTMRITASSNYQADYALQDVSGTIIASDRPIWVLGGTNCAFVPYGQASCDHLQEQLFPIAHWGRRYVGAHAPIRAIENHYWRVYAGADDVTVTTDPPQAGTPVTFAKRGEWVELEVPNGTNFVFDGDGPFMPVQYLSGQSQADGVGDPSMYQMVPVEQFLSRYAFVTGVNYDTDYVQVIRHAGAADVLVDEVVVTNYETVGEFEVANWRIDEGPHLAISDEPFGIVQVGYTLRDASYAYPGGMKVEQLYTP